MLNCLIVGAGGFLGAVLRYLIGLIPLGPNSAFPVKTFIINLVGSFLIGLLAGLAVKNSLDPKLTLFLKVGLCGGFTTFSTFMLESKDLLSGGMSFTAVLYMLLSLVFGLLLVLFGQHLAA